ncbi:MAG TPA: MaoC family dehydratase [Ktedonobacteraceae bacterium]|nr:MaoC family dehydratase [Ktedonobacteraceae bacterium]
MGELQDFTQLKAGAELSPLTVKVTTELNQQFLYAMEDFHPRYIDGSKDGPLAHPGLLLLISFPSKSPSFHLPEGWASIHAADEVQFLHPARVGSTLLIRWKVVKVWEKRGRQYCETETWIVDDQGHDILSRKVSLTYTMQTDAIK